MLESLSSALAGISLAQFALIAGLALFASIVGGVSGYGTGALMPLVLVPIFGPEPVVPMLAISALVNNASRVGVYRHLVDWRRTLVVLPPALPLCLLGAWGYTKLTGKGSLQQKIIKQIPKAFSDLGPTYVKFGQIIASSPGAFGESMSREFRSLLDAVPPADQDEVHTLFKEDLGDEPSKLFKSFDEKPFASASIAQVHYATLHSGEEVVVKIQRPGIRRRVAADLQILKRGAQIVELAKLGRRLSAQNVVPRAQRDTGTMVVREQVIDCSTKSAAEVCVIPNEAR